MQSINWGAWPKTLGKWMKLKSGFMKQLQLEVQQR
jgi:hypothetical protein